MRNNVWRPQFSTLHNPSVKPLFYLADNDDDNENDDDGDDDDEDIYIL